MPLEGETPLVTSRYLPEDSQIELQIANRSEGQPALRIGHDAYAVNPQRELRIAPKSASIAIWNTHRSANWYDMTVDAAGVLYQFAGRIETGRAGYSDPLLAASGAASA